MQRVRESDTCHNCGKSGHWARQCPKKAGINGGTTTATATGDFVGADGKNYQRSLPCPCGAGSCKFSTSNTVKNPGRKFYRCPANDKSKCQFFKWADEVKFDEFINIPFCRCGADFCRVGTETIGPDAGRMCFICPIKKGHGACDYKLWLDAEDLGTTSVQVNESVSSSPSRVACSDVSPTTTDLAEECDVRSRVGNSETSSEDIYYHRRTSPITSGPVKSRKVIVEDEEVSDEPSRKHCKRLRYGELKVDDTSLLSSFASLHLPASNSRNNLAEERPHPSLPESVVEIHPRQTELRKQILVEVSGLATNSRNTLAEERPDLPLQESPEEIHTRQTELCKQTPAEVSATNSRNTLAEERPHLSHQESPEEIHPRQTELCKQTPVEVSATNSRNTLAEERPHLSLQKSPEKIHSRQTELRKQIPVEVSATNSRNTLAEERPHLSHQESPEEIYPRQMELRKQIPVEVSATNSRNTLAEERPHLSLQEPVGEIHPRQTELHKQTPVEVSASGSFDSSSSDSFISPMHLVATRDWIITSIHQNLDLTFHGWWGRLVFPPPRCLMVPSLEHHTASVFPPEPVYIIQDVDIHDYASPATQPRSLLPTESNICTMLTVNQDVQLFGSVKNKSYGRSSREGGQSSIMRCSVSKVFLQAADRLQNDLLSLLESMDIKDHKAMIQEADATFAALDCLGVDRQQYSERVEAFISSASSLAEIESSISSAQCSETLLSHWISKKLNLDELSHAHVEAINASSLAKQRLLNLKEEASVVRARLSQIEAEIVHCEAENSALSCSLEHISGEKKKSEESLSIAFKELEKAQELGKQREAERNAAKAAYETAKAMLLNKSGCLCVTQ